MFRGIELVGKETIQVPPMPPPYPMKGLAADRARPKLRHEMPDQAD
jgi:hypothetical protein